MRTIGSTCAWLSDVCFFLGLKFVSLAHFCNLKGVLFSLPLPPSSLDPSLSIVCREENSSTTCVASFVTLSLLAVALQKTSLFSYVDFSWVVGYSDSFFFYVSFSWATTYTTSFFFFVIVACKKELSPSFLVPMPRSDGCLHSMCHFPTTSFPSAYVTRYDNLYLTFLGSLLVWMDTLWKYTLNAM